MFGDHGGTTAWQKLAALDSNSSNTLTSADTNWSSLHVWQDANENGQVDSGELKTLSSLNITSISTVSNGATTLSGHAIAGASTYVINGNTRTSADTLLDTDRVNSWYVGDGTAGSMDIDMDAIVLPLSRGYGTMPSLHYAMTQDSDLKDIVQEFADTGFSKSTVGSLYSQINDIVLKWAEADGVSPTSRGAYVDARHLAVIEKVTGTPYFNNISQSSDPHFANGPLLEKAYETFKAEIALRLMVQGPLQEIFPDATYDFTEDKITLNDTLTNILDNASILAPSAGTGASLVFWSEVARVIKYAHEEFSLTESAAKAAVDTEAGFEVQIITSYGSDGNDTLTGDSSPYYSYSRDDVFWGGEGNDVIQGNGGYDTIIYNLGDGNDTISSYGEYPIKEDTLLFGEGINPEDIIFTRSGDHLTITFDGNSGSIYLPDQFYDGGQSGYGIEVMKFADNTEWDLQDIREQYLASVTSSGNDTITGFNVNDTIQGGQGDDVINGGGGYDSYIYNLGDGNDTILGAAEYPIKNDVLSFGAGINPEDILFSRSGDDLTLSFSGNSGSVTLQYQLYASGEWGYGVEQVQFANSTVWDLDDLHSGYLNGLATSGNDSITGFNTNDTISGGAGNDTLNGGNGNDVLAGGSGVDNLTGGSGSDIFLYTTNSNSGIGSGNRDIVSDFSQGSDKIDLSGFAGTFAFRGTSAFTGTANEVNYSVVSGNTIIAVDSNGNGSSDFEIQLTGTYTMGSGDFLL